LSIIGHLLYLALATPTMTEIEDVQEAQTSGMLRIILRNGHATDMFVQDGRYQLERIDAAMAENLHHLNIIGLNDRHVEVPVLVVIEDISMVILLPPPSAVMPAAGTVLALDPSKRH